jgi:hypothetical protein
MTNIFGIVFDRMEIDSIDREIYIILMNVSDIDNINMVSFYFI